jgi:hypothetical protein
MIHPKVKASVSASVVLGAVAAVAAQFGVDIPTAVLAAVDTLVVFAAGYIAPSAVTE